MAAPNDEYKVVDPALTRAQAESWERLVKLYPELRAIQTDEHWAKWHDAHKEKNIPYFVGGYRKAATALAIYEQQQKQQIPEIAEQESGRRRRSGKLYMPIPLIDRRRQSAAKKWDQLLSAHPELEKVKTHKEFLAWQKDHPSVKESVWQYQKYHTQQVWQSTLKKYPEIASFQREEEFNAWRTRHPDIKGIAWQNPRSAPAISSPQARNGFALMAKTETLVKNGAYKTSQVKSQPLTPEMAFYKARQEKKQSHSKTPPAPRISNADMRAKFANPNLKVFPQQAPSFSYAPPPLSGTPETTEAVVKKVGGELPDFEIKHPVLDAATPTASLDQSVDTPTVETNYPEQEDDDDRDDNQDNTRTQRRSNKKQGESEPKPESPSGQSLRSRISRITSRVRPLGKNLSSSLQRGGKRLASGLGRSLMRGGSRLATQLALRTAALGAQAGGAVIAAIGWPVIVIILVILLLLLLILVIVFGLPGRESTKEPGILTISLSSEEVQVENPDPTDTSRFSVNINYAIDVSYTGEADDIIVRNPIPENAAFVGAQEPFTRESDGTVVWSVRQLLSAPATGESAGTEPTQGVDPTKYTQAPYHFPTPSSESDISYDDEIMARLNTLGNIVAQYQPFILSKVENDPLLSDPFLSVIWNEAIEGIGHSSEFWVGTVPYFWNCDEQDANGNYERTHRDINQGCNGGYGSGSWQVGYGIQVQQARDHLAEDFNHVYGAGAADDPAKVEQVGQAVIDGSAGKITIVSRFPRRTIPDIVTQANNGDADSQLIMAILLMDQKVGAIAVAREVAGDIIASGGNWSEHMAGWGEYYASGMQRFANRIPALAEAYTGASSGGGVGSGKLISPRATITLTLRPLAGNLNVINQAFAEVIGGTGPVDPVTGTDPGNGTVSGSIATLLPNPLPPDPASASEIKDSILAHFRSHENELIPFYKEAELQSGIPWQVFAGMHWREGDATPGYSLTSGRRIGTYEPDRAAAGDCTGPIGAVDGKADTNCAYANETDDILFAANHLKGKIGKAPATFEDLATALSRYNGTGNVNCGETPYEHCPPSFEGDDSPYALNFFDDKHATMYLRYCADYTPCAYGTRDARPGAATVTKWVAGEFQ